MNKPLRNPDSSRAVFNPLERFAFDWFNHYYPDEMAECIAEYEAGDPRPTENEVRNG